MAEEVKHTALINASSQIIDGFKIRGRTIKEWYTYFELNLDSADTLDNVTEHNCKVSVFSHEVSFYVNTSRLRLLSLREDFEKASRQKREQIITNPPANVRLTQDRIANMVDIAVAEYSKAYRIAEFEFEFWESVSKLLSKQADRIDKQIMIQLSERKYTQ